MGERGEPEVNNLVYMKRRKHIYAIRKHETTERKKERKRDKETLEIALLLPLLVNLIGLNKGRRVKFE